MDFLTYLQHELAEIGTLVKVLVVVSLVGAVLPWYIRTSRTSNLSEKFRAAGDMSGLLMQQVIDRVGKPSNIVYTPSGRVLTWAAPGYMITLLFDINGIFVGIQSEHATA